MSRIKHFVIALLAGGSSHFSTAQIAYIATDSLLSNGVDLLEGNSRENAQFIRVNNKGIITRYTPSDISEYGLNDGRIFLAKNIGTTRYFLERLFNGPFKVYYLADKSGKPPYYITPHDSIRLVAIPRKRKEYIPFIKRYITNCPQALKNVEHVQLTRHRLVRFFSDYQTCSNSHHPRFRYGVKMGISINKFVARKSSSTLSKPVYKQNTDFFLGAFIDSPIRATNFSLNTGLSLHNYSSSFVFKDAGETYDLFVSQWRLDLPILLRYTFFNKSPSPFVEVGPVYSGRILGESTLINYKTVGNNVFINFDELPAISNHQAGFSLASGMILKYDSNYSLLLQVGYQKLYPVSKSSKLTVSELLFSIGLLF